MLFRSWYSNIFPLLGAIPQSSIQVNTLITPSCGITTEKLISTTFKTIKKICNSTELSKFGRTATFVDKKLVVCAFWKTHYMYGQKYFALKKCIWKVKFVFNKKVLVRGSSVNWEMFNGLCLVFRNRSSFLYIDSSSLAKEISSGKSQTPQL